MKRHRRRLYSGETVPTYDAMTITELLAGPIGDLNVALQPRYEGAPVYNPAPMGAPFESQPLSSGYGNTGAGEVSSMEAVEPRNSPHDTDDERTSELPPYPNTGNEDHASPFGSVNPKGSS